MLTLRELTLPNAEQKPTKPTLLCRRRHQLIKICSRNQQQTIKMSSWHKTLVVSDRAGMKSVVKAKGEVYAMQVMKTEHETCTSEMLLEIYVEDLDLICIKLYIY